MASAEAQHIPVPTSVSVPLSYEDPSLGTDQLALEYAAPFDAAKRTVPVIADGQQFYVRPKTQLCHCGRMQVHDFRPLDVSCNDSTSSSAQTRLTLLATTQPTLGATWSLLLRRNPQRLAKRLHKQRGVDHKNGKIANRSGCRRLEGLFYARS